MTTVKAPEGYEGHRYWNDGSRGWTVSVRRVGDKWWKVVATVGDAHVMPEDLDQRAEAAIARHVQIHSAVAS